MDGYVVAGSLIDDPRGTSASMAGRKRNIAWLKCRRAFAKPHEIVQDQQRDGALTTGRQVTPEVHTRRERIR